MSQNNNKAKRLEPFKKTRLIKTTQSSDRGNIFMRLEVNNEKIFTP
ncbi:MAG: hypothetical protein ACTSQJ_09105 [Promethearchaeota archaeon]